MSNHYSAIQDLSNLPLHSLHILTCSESNMDEKWWHGSAQMNIQAILYDFHDSPFLTSCGRMPLTAVR